MKKSIQLPFLNAFIFVSVLGAGMFFTSCVDGFFKPKMNLPEPEMYQVLADGEETGEYHKLKEQYKKQIYFDPNVNVDSIRQVQLEQRNKDLNRRSRTTASFVNGNLNGEWFERGPNNETGDLREVDYDPTTDSMYVLTTVGHIFKGNSSNGKWKLLNDKIRFRTDIFAHVRQGSINRLFAIQDGNNKDNKRLRYSNDEGKTWSFCGGLGDKFYDHYGNPIELIKMNDNKTLYYFVWTWQATPWGSAIHIYKSTDSGLNFSFVTSFDGSSNNLGLWKPHDKNEIHILDNTSKKFYKLTHNSNGSHTLGTGVSVTGLPNGNSFQLTGRYVNNSPIFYTYFNNVGMHKCTAANGSAWSFRSAMKNQDNGVRNPDRSVFFASPFSDKIYMGHFQLNYTTDEINWKELYNYWWTYYDPGTFGVTGRLDNLHVDHMDIKVFRKSNGSYFIAELNHAGIHITSDDFTTTKNIGVNDLNMVTLYGHATANDGTIFAGAQDKGTMRSVANNNANTNTFATENQTTGDGMRQLFCNNGTTWVGTLQNGSLYTKWNKNNNYNATYDIKGNDTPGWITPIAAHGNPAEKKFYACGGNINGGTGSYLIRFDMSWGTNGSNFQWNPTQLNYNFRSNSKSGSSSLSEVETCKSDYNRIYTTTSDGTFFYSNDAGISWAKSTTNIPVTYQWNSIHCIAASPKNANKVAMGGSGWSNTGVYLSNDGGKTFSALSVSIPKAYFFDLVWSSDEKYLFAATSEGPYVYSTDESKWFDLSSSNTPYVEFRCVEYIESIKTVRFSTFGRGIWDFKIQTTVPQGPFTGTPIAIPGTIEMENFDLGGQAVAYNDSETTNQGLTNYRNEGVDIVQNGNGFAIGYTADGEWLKYTVNVSTAGLYDFEFSVASLNGGGNINVKSGSNNIISNYSIPSTGGWNIYRTYTIQANLIQGKQEFQFEILNAGFDIDKIVVRKSVATSLNNFFNTDETFATYPNPSRNGFFNLSESTTYQVFNAQGFNIMSGEGKTISLFGYLPGVYLLKTKFGTEKLVLE